MDITPLIPEGRQIVQSYAHGKFRVSGQVYDGPVVVFTDHTVPWPVKKPVSQMTAEDFAPILSKQAELDVILVGCGETMNAMPFALRQELKEQGVSADFMDSGAACRTYNVLMTEGRRVAAALLPI